jgi:hypothetical protein
MNINTLVTKLILLEIIKEAGDLKNISTYPYNNNQFITSEGFNVKVELNLIPIEEYTLLNISNKRDKVRNVSYSVEDNQSQHKKTTYKELIKILKTVSEIVKEELEKNKDIEGLVIFAAHKNPKFVTTHTDPQKSKLYTSILTNQILELGGWNIKSLNVEEDKFKGILLYKN